MPRPTLATLLPSTFTTGKFGPTDFQKHATTHFIHVCALTELLGEILPLVYQVQPLASDFDSTSHSAASDHAIQNSKKHLDILERQLPPWRAHASKPGLSNLWFCFLSTRLLLSRVKLRAAVAGGDVALKKAKLVELHSAAKGVLEFVLKLGQSEFRDFWFPYTTHLLVQAVTGECVEIFVVSLTFSTCYSLSSLVPPTRSLHVTLNPLLFLSLGFMSTV